MLHSDINRVLGDGFENLFVIFPILIIPLFTYIAVTISRINRKVCVLSKENTDYKKAFEHVNKQLESLTSKNQEYKKALIEVNHELDALTNMMKDPTERSVNTPPSKSLQELDCLINKIGNILEDSSI